MPAHICLLNLTDQGIRNIKGSPDRINVFRAMAGQFEVTVKDAYYTLGSHDMVLILEGGETDVAAAVLSLESLGNTRAQVLRAFSLEEMRAVIAKMP